jgi:Flp pilus assembly pilin Flp
MIDRIVVWALTLKARASSERGQDLVEYGLLTGGIAIALIAAVALFSGAAEGWFNSLAVWFNNLAP